MKHFFNFLLLAVIGFGSILNAQTTWNCDLSHSAINFSVGYLNISKVPGNFKAFEGSIKTSTADFVGAKIDFTVDVNSINTNIEQRDVHLKSADFFDAATHGKMTFSSTSFKKQGKKYQLEGNLTIKGITKKTTFVVTYGGTAKDPYGNERIGFTLNSTIKRSDFQINGAKEVVADAVDFTLNLNFTKAK